jgi:hypothetical protein
MNIDLLDLKRFLLIANKNGYASPSAKITKEDDDSTTIEFRDADWRMHDNFLGGEPYGGREILFYKDKPTFIMVYYGWVDKNMDDFNEVYTFLRNALALSPPENPYRGPKKYKEGRFEYVNNWTGDIENFQGEEIILKNSCKVYTAKYIGGLIDQS